jgi:DNA polymerase III subunit delta'
VTRLSAIAGHERATQQLRAAAAGGRPANAYLFAGPPGVGKRTTADAFTASLLCAAPEEGDACGACGQCLRVAAGTHPDVWRVRREEERRDIRTEQARETSRWLTLRPLYGARKVALIEEAECLNEHGQNALLKTLEEPPGAAVLVLLATDASLLLPTVRSRCVRLRFDPLPTAVVERLLTEQGVVAPTRAALAARARGSIGRALALLDDPDADARLRVVARLADLGTASAADLSGLAQALGRDQSDVVLETAVGWYRDLLGLVVDEPEAALQNVDVAGPLRAAAGRATVAQVLRALEAVCDTIRAVDRNANRVLALETLLLRLRDLERHPPIAS